MKMEMVELKYEDIAMISLCYARVQAGWEIFILINHTYSSQH